MISVSIIIINYNTAALIEQCIASILKHENILDYEIIVIDNNSQDDIETVLLNFGDIDIKFIQMGYNSGFSRANNAGMKIAQGEKILLLNSDTFLIKKDTIRNCIDFLNAKSQKDVIAPVLLNEDLTYQCSARHWFFGITDLIYGNPIFILFTRRIKNYRFERNKKDKLLHLKTNEVKWINGAFQLFNRILIDEYELYYDENFFLYGEDVEWAYRVRQFGGKFYLFGDENLIHLGSASSSNLNLYKEGQVELSNWLFIRKSYGTLYFVIYTLFDFLNLFLDNLLNKKKTTSIDVSNKKFRLLKQYLYKKYFLEIVFFRENRNEHNFKFNIYENDKEFIENENGKH